MEENYGARVVKKGLGMTKKETAWVATPGWRVIDPAAQKEQPSKKGVKDTSGQDVLFSNKTGLSPAEEGAMLWGKSQRNNKGRVPQTDRVSKKSGRVS